jgi:hypothetical protein
VAKTPRVSIVEDRTLLEKRKQAVPKMDVSRTKTVGTRFDSAREVRKMRDDGRLTKKKAAGNLLDYVRSFSPDEELASAVEKVLEKRGKTRLRSAEF